MNLAVWAVILASLLACFFAAANYALLDFSRSRLVEMFERRGRPERADELVELRPGLLLVTAVLRAVLHLGILLAMIAVLAPPGTGSSWTALAIAFGGAGGLIVVFGVAIPLSWSRHAAEPLLVLALPVLRGIYRSCKPLMTVLHWLDPLVRRLLGVPKPEDGDAAPFEQEILDAVSEGEKSGLVGEEQKEMIEAVVEFPSITVEQIMTPRTEIEGVEVGSSLEDVKSFVAEAGHSRIPVYDNDLDHIVGVLYVKDLIPLLGLNGDHPFNLRDIAREAVFVPESKALADLLTQFKAQKVHLAMVLDEYGGTAGLVTIEDVLEEIVGEIHDEYEPIDEEEPGIEPIDEQRYDVHARVRIDDLNDQLRIELPENEDYDTVGGFVFATLGHIPEVGESFDHDGLRITVTDAEKTRINRLRIERLDEEGAEQAPAAEQP